MLTARTCVKGWAWWALGAAVSIVAPHAAPAQDDEEPEAPSYREAYLGYVDRQLAGLQTEVNNQRIILNERGQELLEEIGIRLEEARGVVPSYIPLPGEEPPPDPPSVVRLNEYDRILSEEVYQIEVRVLDQLDAINLERDSVALDLKRPDDVRPVVDELDKSIRTELELWRTKVGFVQGRLIADGTPDQARRMFVRSYNAVALHYQMGQYQLALDLIATLSQPYGDLPLAEWRESLPFYKAECQYALGLWDDAFAGYQAIWEQQTHLYAQQGLLNWSELAFAGGEYRKLATMWVAQPRLPDEVIDANRIRLLVAESFVRLKEPKSALAVLDQIVAERPVSGDRESLAPEEIAELQALNTRLAVYGQLLRAEAHLSDVPERKLEISELSETETLPDYTELLGEVNIPSVDQLDQSKLDTVLAATSAATPKVDTSLYYAKAAFLIASGKLRSTKEQTDAQVDAAVRDLEGLVPVVRRIDREGPLMARALIALGHAYFQNRRFGDAAAAYGAVPLSSVWYPEANLGRAWAFMEEENYFEAKASINIARRWPLNPSAVLEASALNSFILSQVGEDSLAAAEVQLMMVSVTVEERRGMSAWVARQLQQINESLRLIGVLSLERQNEELYRATLGEQVRLDGLRAQVRLVEQYLQEYALGKLESRAFVTEQIHGEQERLRALQSRITEMRRQAGQAPARGSLPELSYSERRSELEHWLRGVEPAEISVERSVYEEWVEYAEFAYAKRIFEENQRRRNESARLKTESARISRLLTESP